MGKSQLLYLTVLIENCVLIKYDLRTSYTSPVDKQLSSQVGKCCFQVQCLMPLTVLPNCRSGWYQQIPQDIKAHLAEVGSGSRQHCFSSSHQYENTHIWRTHLFIYSSSISGFLSTAASCSKTFFWKFLHSAVNLGLQDKDDHAGIWASRRYVCLTQHFSLH